MDDLVRAVRPLVDYVDPIDIPLAEYFDVKDLASGGLIENILVADAWTDLGAEGFQLGAEFHFGGIEDLHLPGLDQFKLSFNEDAFAQGLLVLSEDPSLTIDELEIALTLDERILRAPAGGGAKIEATCGLRFDSSGFHFLSMSKASIADALIAGTDISISLTDISLDAEAEDWLKVGTAAVTLPMFEDDDGDPLKLAGRDVAIGEHGPSGTFERAEGSPLPFSIGDFAGELDQAAVELHRGQLIRLDIKGRLDLSDFLEGREDGWVAVEFKIGPEGLVAALSDDEPIIELPVEKMFSLSVDTIRLEADGQGHEATLWMAGALTPEIEGAADGWPTIEFSGLGISAAGELRLAEGASIATTQPFSVDWNFLRLTVDAFRLERTAGTGSLELRLSAGVEILEGIPAGASVEGLVVRRDANGDVDVHFDGIGVTFGTPGAFCVGVSIAWDSHRHALSGTGHLDISALDIRLDVVFEAAQEDGVTTLFVTAETDLIPGGIPIGATGLCLYSVSGLLAHNKAIKLTSTGPRRYFEAFKQEPAGFASLSKWETHEGAEALAIGVVVGTADDGWMFSVRGGLLLSIPDLAILVTASAQLLDERPSMTEAGSAKLAAVLALLPAERLLRLDFEAEWKEPHLFEVQASGFGEFHFDQPLDWRLQLGEHPDRGRPVSARVIELAGNWLLTADYWFGLAPASGTSVGARTGLSLRAGGGSVYAEIVGTAEAYLDLFWKPSQLDGGITLQARGRLAAGPISIAFSIGAAPSVSIDHPLKVEIPLEACIEIDLVLDSFTLCLHYTFAWRRDEPPPLSSLLQGLQVVPRHWSPPPDKPDDNGIRGNRSDAAGGDDQLGMVAPHSELVLEFSKSVAVAIPAGGSVVLNGDGKPTGESVGDKSGWWQRWTLAELELFDQTDRYIANVFGTFSRSPLDRTDEAGNKVAARPPNTELRLLSSRRFGQDGSLGGGGVEETPSVDCDPCCNLAHLATGKGILPNGWTYTWIDGGYHTEERDNRYGVGMAPEDGFTVYPPDDVEIIHLTVADYHPHTEPDPATVRTIDIPGPFGSKYHLPGRELLAMRLCWERRAPPEGGAGRPHEEWTVPPAERFLIPGHSYSLKVVAEGRMINVSGASGQPIRTERSYEFTASRAPDWDGALTRAIDAVYPDDGRRPVFRDYDLLVRFKDDIFEPLYALDDRLLGARIRDANGDVVAGPNGDVLLPTSWAAGPIVRSPAEAWWHDARQANAGDGCEGGHEPAPEGKTVLPIALHQLALAPLARYDVEVVAVDANMQANATPPLARWSFTTSRFRTFSDLAAPPTRVPELGLIQSRPATDPGDFGELIAAFDAPPVMAADIMRMTPVRAGNHCAYLLIEAPEPLDDALGRLSIHIEGRHAAFVHNLDRTRLVAQVATPIELADEQTVISVQLEWIAAPANAQAEDRRTIEGKPMTETVLWTVPLKGLF